MSWFFGEVVNEWFQNTFPWMEWPFKIITFLGDPIVYIIILAIAFWILNKKDAIIAIYVLLTASFLNFFLKVVIQKPRPNVTRLARTNINYRLWLDNVLFQENMVICSCTNFSDSHMSLKSILRRSLYW
ncbi:MAG: hypothetical protein ACTSR1_13545 [Candidatus Heimdallarchaeota archaeon]